MKIRFEVENEEGNIEEWKPPLWIKGTIKFLCWIYGESRSLNSFINAMIKEMEKRGKRLRLLGDDNTIILRLEYKKDE